MQRTQQATTAASAQQKQIHVIGPYEFLMQVKSAQIKREETAKDNQDEITGVPCRLRKRKKVHRTRATQLAIDKFPLVAKCIPRAMIKAKGKQQEYQEWNKQMKFLQAVLQPDATPGILPLVEVFRTKRQYFLIQAFNSGSQQTLGQIVDSKQLQAVQTESDSAVPAKIRQISTLQVEHIAQQIISTFSCIEQSKAVSNGEMQFVHGNLSLDLIYTDGEENCSLQGRDKKTGRKDSDVISTQSSEASSRSDASKFKVRIDLAKHYQGVESLLVSDVDTEEKKVDVTADIRAFGSMVNSLLAVAQESQVHATGENASRMAVLTDLVNKCQTGFIQSWQQVREHPFCISEYEKAQSDGSPVSRSDEKPSETQEPTDQGMNLTPTQDEMAKCLSVGSAKKPKAFNIDGESSSVLAVQLSALAGGERPDAESSGDEFEELQYDPIADEEWENLEYESISKSNVFEDSEEQDQSKYATMDSKQRSSRGLIGFVWSSMRKMS